MVECVPLRRGPTFLSVAITGLRACYSSKNRVLSLYTKQQPGSPAERKKQCRSVGHDPYWMIILLDDKESCHRVPDNFFNRASRGTHSRRSTADPCFSSPNLPNRKISLLPLPLASTQPRGRAGIDQLNERIGNLRRHKARTLCWPTCRISAARSPCRRVRARARSGEVRTRRGKRGGTRRGPGSKQANQLERVGLTRQARHASGLYLVVSS